MRRHKEAVWCQNLPLPADIQQSACISSSMARNVSRSPAPILHLFPWHSPLLQSNAGTFLSLFPATDPESPYSVLLISVTQLFQRFSANEANCLAPQPLNRAGTDRVGPCSSFLHSRTFSAQRVKATAKLPACSPFHSSLSFSQKFQV